jgi:D-apionolactonase
LSSTSPTDRAPVHTGPLAGTVVDGQLRAVRIAGTVALDAVYAAVRDPEWATVPGVFSAYDVSVSSDSFAASFTCRHGDTFEWRGRIVGRDGVITFEFDGVALRHFAANRIGFCLLHPLELVCHPVLARTVTGTVESTFPERISPNRPFLELQGLRYEVATGTWLDVSFDGDLFEMEDHRNWTDAGWKTYCPPVGRPHPVTYVPGDRVHQTVTLSACTDRAGVRAMPSPPALPALGFGAAQTGLDDRAAARLRTLRPAHVRVELAATTHWQNRLASAAAEAAALDTQLDVDVVAPPGATWNPVAAALAAQRQLGRVAVFDEATQVTTPGMAAALRDALHDHGAKVPVGGGSHASFAELNSADLPPDGLDFITYGITPQMHHFDDVSIMDTLRAQPHTVRDARQIAGDLPIVVGPVTLHPRAPDPRQATDFLAAWTVGSIAALAEAGADSVTYYQTFGAAGLGTADAAYPVHRVFAALAGLGGHPVHRLDAPPREVAAIAVGSTLLVANLRDIPRTIRLDGHLDLGPYEVVVVVARG